MNSDRDVDLRNKISELNQKITRLQFGLGLVGALHLISLLPGLSSPANAAPQTVRAQNFVVVDAANREVAKFGLEGGGSAALKIDDANRDVLVLGQNGNQFGLSVTEPGTKSTIRLGILEPDSPLPNSRPLGLTVAGGNRQRLDLTLDAEFRRPSLMLGSPEGG